MDSNIGRNLIKIIDAIPVLDPQAFDTLMTNQMNVRKILFFLNYIEENFLNIYFLKDLLMVTYLSNLVKAQLALNERIATL